MKIDKRTVMQYVGMIVGGAICIACAMDQGSVDGIRKGYDDGIRKGYDDGIRDGAIGEARSVSRAIYDAYEKEQADDIKNRVNAKFDEYASKK